MFYKNLIFIVFSILFLTSCGQDPKSLTQTNPDMLSAQGQRGQIACSCAFHYDPVCGVNGLSYINSCIASCEGISYRSGACADGEKACNPGSGYVCGQPECFENDCATNGMPPVRVFANECIMMQSKAVFLHKGYCQ